MRYEVTAKITIEAEDAHEAVAMFDEEYRDTFNVVHLRAVLLADGYDRPAEGQGGVEGQRRNGFTAVYK